MPPKQQLINTFKHLADKIGPERVVWRYDPIILTDKYTADYHADAFGKLLQALAPYTKRCVVSFVDLYTKTSRNMQDIKYEELTGEKMRAIAKNMAQQTSTYKLTVESCAEKIDLGAEGIQHTHCIDAEIIKNIVKTATGCDMNLDNQKNKDKNQRPECGCVASIDMGAYNTCMHGCKYCYANWNLSAVKKNFAQCDKNSPLLYGNISPSEMTIERKEKDIKSQIIRERVLF